MIRITIAIFTTGALLLGATAPSWAQREGGGIFDVLGDILRGQRSLRGHVVLVEQQRLVVRGEDGRTYALSAAAVDPSTLSALQPGQPVTVETRGAGQGNVLIASSVRPESGPARTFHRVEGTVESVSGSRATFKTREGMVIPVDLSQLVGGKPEFQPNEPATLIYEQSQRVALAGVWIEPRDRAPAASVPSEPMAGGYQRLHGYVESVGLRSLMLKTDDGRTVQVDLGQVSEQVRVDTRPGDVVTVVGKLDPRGNRFAAEFVQKDR